MNSNSQHYFLKALDHFPMELAECHEKLNYALSIEPEHPDANVLMARIYLEYFKDRKNCKYHLERAISGDPGHEQAFAMMLRLAVIERDDRAVQRINAFLERERILAEDFRLYQLAIHHELNGNFKKALEFAKASIMVCVQSETIRFLDDMVSRLERKKRDKKNLKS
jgi:hypothetical protein